MAQIRPSDRARLQSVLATAGVDLSPEELAADLETALRQIRVVDMRADVGRQFSESDEAALREGGLDLDARRPDEPSAGAVTAAEMTALLVDSIAVSETARRMGVNQSRIRQMLGERSLFGIKGERGWQVPLFQFAGDRPIPGVAAVLRAMPEDLHPVEVWVWLSSPEPDLNVRGRAVSPLAWLRSGGSPEPVARLATDL
jgi:hypothetical protein